MWIILWHLIGFDKFNLDQLQQSLWQVGGWVQAMLFQKPVLFDEKPKYFLQLTWQMFDHIPMYLDYYTVRKKVQGMTSYWVQLTSWSAYLLAAFNRPNGTNVCFEMFTSSIPATVVWGKR